MRTALRRAGWAAARWLGRLAFVLAHLWCVGAIWFLGSGTRWYLAVLALLYALVLPAAWFLLPRRRRQLALGFLALVGVLALVGFLKRPSTERDWTRDMVRPPVVSIDGHTVRIEHVRDCVYRSETDYDVRWRDEAFDLRELDQVDFLVERFHAWDALAHTLLSFGFRDGRRVTISVELRREKGEGFHPVAGIYQQFELMYVVGTERDVLGLRTNHRGSRAWLYPVRTTPERMRGVFLAMLRRADALGREPEFYNTLTSSCTTNIVTHVRDLVPGRIPRDLRILVPGHAAALAHEIGLIDTDLPLDEAMDAFRIDRVAREGPLDGDYSRRIRSRRPAR